MVIKVSVVLFVIALGSHYVNTGNWGTRLVTLSRPSASPASAPGAAYIFFAYIGFDAVSTTAQEAKNPQRDLPIGIIASLSICTVLYIAVAAVLTGMVPWQRDQYRSADRPRLSGSRPDHRFAHHHHRARWPA